DQQGDLLVLHRWGFCRRWETTSAAAPTVAATAAARPAPASTSDRYATRRTSGAKQSATPSATAIVVNPRRPERPRKNGVRAMPTATQITATAPTSDVKVDTVTSSSAPVGGSRSFD